METEKSIVIGCDNTEALAIVLKSMKEITPFSYHSVTATRISDLLSIVKSLNPDLVILCFRNNQLALDDFNTFVRRSQLPLLCISDRHENDRLRWNPGSIVFTCPLEYVGDEQYLSSRIHSIFLLSGERSESMARPISRETHIQASHFSGSRNLSRYVLELDQKIEVLHKVKDRITDLYPHVDDPARIELNSIVHSIKMSANDNKLWDDFKLYFEETHPEFLLQLAERYPELTSKDLKYCCYLKMNMSNDDIRNLLGINQESVRTHKYRLKKKMALCKDDDLRGYLRSIGQQVA